MNNWKILKKQLENYKISLIINLFSIMLLIDIKEEDDDYYYVFEQLDWSLSLCSAVSKPIFLKDNIQNIDYTRLVEIWNLNSRNTKI